MPKTLSKVDFNIQTFVLRKLQSLNIFSSHQFEPKCDKNTENDPDTRISLEILLVQCATVDCGGFQKKLKKENTSSDFYFSTTVKN